MDIDGVIIFNSGSGIPLFSKLDEKINASLFSGFMTAIRMFCSEIALGGLTSCTTDQNRLFLAAKDNLVTTLITSKKQDSKELYSLAYQITETFAATYQDLTGYNTDMYKTFSKPLDEILKGKFSLPLDEQTISMYSIDSAGELNPITIDDPTLPSIPIIIVVNTIIKQIFLIENQEEISNRQTFLARRAALQLNKEHWKNEFRIQDVSDPIISQRILEQANNLIVEIMSSNLNQTVF